MTREVKKKLVALTEQALTAGPRSYDSYAVDKALQAALVSINQLQVTPKRGASTRRTITQPEVLGKPVACLDYDKAYGKLVRSH